VSIISLYKDPEEAIAYAIVVVAMFWMLLLVALIRIVFHFASMEKQRGGEITAAVTYFSVLIIYTLVVLLPMMQIFTNVSPIRWYVFVALLKNFNNKKTTLYFYINFFLAPFFFQHCVGL